MKGVHEIAAFLFLFVVVFFLVQINLQTIKVDLNFLLTDNELIFTNEILLTLTA